jgi:transposase
MNVKKCYTIVMPMTYKITNEDALTARKLMENNTLNTNIVLKLMVIALRGEGLKNSEIVKLTKLSKGYVPIIVSTFIHKGFEGLVIDNRGGNNRRVTEWQEKKFLKSWRQKAETGKIITTKEMWLDFQQRYNVEITLQAFHRLLKRHKWSKTQPRKRHIKSADAITKRASKKLSHSLES